MCWRNTWFFVLCVVILIGLIFLKPSYGWAVRTWLSPSADLQTDNPTLVTQNEALQAQLAELQGIQSQLPDEPTNYIRAMVYSRYPLNFKNQLLVNMGSNEGVMVGHAVVFQGVLIGVVQQVFADSSLVQTVFDSNFKMPLRVGSAGYDALLVGGTYPQATSIQKGTLVTVGDIAYAAAPGIPYGLPVGLVSGTSTSADNLFEQATLAFAYDLNTIQTVLIAQ